MPPSSATRPLPSGAMSGRPDSAPATPRALSTPRSTVRRHPASRPVAGSRKSAGLTSDQERTITACHKAHYALAQVQGGEAGGLHTMKFCIDERTCHMRGTKLTQSQKHNAAAAAVQSRTFRQLVQQQLADEVTVRREQELEAAATGRDAGSGISLHVCRKQLR